MIIAEYIKINKMRFLLSSDSLSSGEDTRKQILKSMRYDTHQRRNMYKVVSKQRDDAEGRRQVASQKTRRWVVTPSGLMGGHR